LGQNQPIMVQARRIQYSVVIFRQLLVVSTRVCFFPTT
jgi:hypothetical protein